jgi:hypothetical protein
VIITDPPGDPVAITGTEFLKTRVGVIELKGLLKGSILFASPPNNPN